VSAAVATGTGELLAELRRLTRLPVPQPVWYPYVPLIGACRHEFEQALALAAAHPDALDLLAALADGAAQLAFDPDASRELSAAWRRLEALPIPEGQHPYLDDILLALEALRLLLVALSHSGIA
jgi:hypothetical protein